MTKTTETDNVEIRTIDVVVFPDWCGGTFSRYYDPVTFEKKNFNTFGSEELAEKWVKRAKEIQADPSRLLIHLHEGKGNTSTRPFLQDYVKLIESITENNERFIEVNGYRLRDGLKTSLGEIVKQKELIYHPEVKVFGYGHHMWDCVPDYGTRATVSLGLDESRFYEENEMCVGDKTWNSSLVIAEENPALFEYYSYENWKQHWDAHNMDEAVKLNDAMRYLLIYCNLDQIRAAARQADSVEQFEDLIGGHFKGFNFSDDFERICDEKSKHDKRERLRELSRRFYEE
ncbi:hypothetical protein HOC35_06425 [Candidatus Woesearchaeota archaeon]|nr:hypothetical protein [Candidatus Woesearchaeota archaeon]